MTNLRDLIADKAAFEAISDPAKTYPISEPYYRGRGNPCQLIAIAFQQAGIGKQQRLDIINGIFGTNVRSMKELSVAQVIALCQFRDQLGEICRTNETLSSSSLKTA